MRLVDFLIHLLEAHAGTLNRLAALLGEDSLTELLEMSGESRVRDDRKLLLHQEPQYFNKTLPQKSASVYAELESAVRSFNLAPTLEFHLWTYPYYRAYIESSLDLNAALSSHGEAGIGRLADEAFLDARAWARTLPLSPDLAKQADHAAEVPWIKFRAALLKKTGQRPLGSVF